VPDAFAALARAEREHGTDAAGRSQPVWRPGSSCQARRYRAFIDDDR
jgi:hypothetical protein